MRQKALRMSFKWLQCSLVALGLLLSSTLVAQVTGTVVDASNDETLIGASVLISGTGTGTVTDIDGNFSIDANAGDVLEISYTGYSTQNITVGAETNLSIRLSQGVLIDEVVVTGYSSQRKRDITGAVAVVDAEELNSVTATSFAQKLQGKVTGVTIQTDGSPGAGSVVRIRGISSFQNNDPLYIIDGVPTTDTYNTGINPNDIESIQVLKDASAASIYGARANNGVVIITTKRGQKGKTTITYNATVGSQTPVGKYDLLVDPAQYSEVVWRSFENSGQGGIPAEVPYSAGRGVIPDYLYAGDFSGYPQGQSVNEGNYSYPNNLIMRSNPGGTDWWDEVFSPALVTEHNLGVSGGGEHSTFAMSFGYLDQNGTMLHTDFDRLSVRANSTFKKGRFTLGENFSFARSTSTSQAGGNQSEQNVMTQILKAQSIIPVYDIQGNFAGGKANGLSNGSNPVAQQIRSKDNPGVFYKALGNAFMEVELVEGLSVRTSLGIEFFNNFTGSFSLPTWEESEPNTTNRWQEANDNGFNWTWTNTAKYTKNIGGLHDITALVGYEALRVSGRNISGDLSNYFTTDPNAWYLNTGLGAPDSRNVNSYGYFSTLASSFAKLDYAFDDTYILSVTVRRDGSSNFGRDERYGVFPAFSLGWRVSNTFLKDVDAIDDLKVRVSYGITGNQSIPGGNTVNRFGGGPGSSFYDINGVNNSLATGYALTNRGNLSTKWEEAKSLNFGIDGSLLNGKLDFVLDLYQRTTDGLLLNPDNPATAGYAAPAFINIAKMQNKGAEFAINFREKSSSKFGYNIGLNVSAYKNEILEIDGARTEFFSPGSGRIGNTGFNAIGGSISEFYGWQADGIFRSQAEVDAHADQGGKAVGQIRLKDLNADGVIDDGDLGSIGSPHPDFTFGINLGVNFGAVDITTFWTGSVGNEIYNYNKLFEVFRFFNSNVRKDVLDKAFDPVSNPNGEYPLINEDDIFSENSTSFYVEDGSYLRLTTLQIGYTIPSDVLGKLGLGSARVYLQGQNLLTFTKYTGIDPTLSSFNISNNDGINQSDQRMGFDFGNYPASKIVQVGVNVSF